MSTDLSPRRRTALLVVIAVSLMTVVSAVSGLNVALPSLQRDTGATQSEIQWIVDSYTLVFAGLLLAVGALGDRIGRKPVLLAGLAVFGVASAFGLFLSDPSTLIAVRACMGVGAAAIMPVTLSVITTSFPPDERAKAVGVWVGVAGGGAVIGLFGSGILLEFFEWNSFFGLNVTLAVLGLVGGALVVPNSRDEHPPALDPVGSVLSLALVGGLVLGFIEGGERGWGDPLAVSGFVVGGLALVCFVLWELRQEQPLLDPRLFRLAGFSTGTLSMTVQFFASFGFFYIGLQYLQYVAGLSPLQAACALLPMPIVLIPLARQAPLLAQRFGTNRIAGSGLLLAATGMVLLSLGISTDLVYWQFGARARGVRSRHGPVEHPGDHGDHLLAAAHQAGSGIGGQRRLARARLGAGHRDPGQRPELAVPRQPRPGRDRPAPRCRRGRHVVARRGAAERRPAG